MAMASVVFLFAVFLSAIAQYSEYPAINIPNSQCSLGSVELPDDLMDSLQQMQPMLQRCQDATHSGYSSCQEVLSCDQDASSGYYGIKTSNGSVVQVYCDMEGTHCGGEGGWMRIAYVNMTQPNATCPNGLHTLNYWGGRTFCGAVKQNKPQCASTTFSSEGWNYSSVCGQVRGYSFRTPDGFHRYLTSGTTIDGPYVDGVSITYGSPRNHIWTYAAGRLDNNVNNECPCNAVTSTSTPPYVGDNYYCETGGGTADILWDGQNCATDEAPCCDHSDLPWFVRNLGVTTNDDVELRACRDQVARDENVPLDIIELYIR